MSSHSETLLKENRLRVTPARVAVLDLFGSTCAPLTADDIAHKTTDTKINLVTIYRTLESLEKAGLLRQVDLRRGAICYERTDTHHHHIVCTDCGAIEEIDVCDQEQLAKDALKSSKKFKRINQHALEFFGICSSCTRS